LDIRRLTIFCKVVELKSFTKASEAVLLSQPTISENIRLLEESFDEKLLDRLGREVLPTPAGLILYQYAQRILQLRDEAVQALRQFRGSLSGTLPLGASTIPGAYILPALIESFKSAQPEIQVSLKVAGTAHIAEALLRGELEVGILGARWKNHLLDCEEIFADELVVTVYPGHPLAERKEIDLGELADHPFILREQGSGTRLVMTRELKEHGVDPARLRVVAEMGSTEAVRQGIKARLGISILSSLAVLEDLQRGTLVQVPVRGVRIKRSFYLARRKNRQPTPLALSFINHLQAHRPG
jgi:DNA-binding transcriptional LysR family regulator